MKSLLRERPLALICDLHGHSRRQGAFMYGCLPEKHPQHKQPAAGVRGGGG
jgi:hypothetical protein